MMWQGQIAKQSIDENKSVRELCLEQLSELKITKKELDGEILNPYKKWQIVKNDFFLIISIISFFSLCFHSIRFRCIRNQESC